MQCRGRLCGLSPAHCPTSRVPRARAPALSCRSTLTCKSLAPHRCAGGQPRRRAVLQLLVQPRRVRGRVHQRHPAHHARRRQPQLLRCADLVFVTSHVTPPQLGTSLRAWPKLSCGHAAAAAGRGARPHSNEVADASGIRCACLNRPAAERAAAAAGRERGRARGGGRAVHRARRPHGARGVAHRRAQVRLCRLVRSPRPCMAVLVFVCRWRSSRLRACRVWWFGSLAPNRGYGRAGLMHVVHTCSCQSCLHPSAATLHFGQSVAVLSKKAPPTLGWHLPCHLTVVLGALSK